MSDNLKFFHLPIDESQWHSAREWRITICCVFGTLIFGGFTLIDQLPILFEECVQGDWSGGIGHFFYLLTTALLIYGGVVYQITRAFYIRRRSKTFKQLRQPVEATSRNITDVTVLVPSFKEEYNTIYQTLMSAVFQEFVTKRLVLLIDNPPNTADPEELKLLQRARGIPTEIRELLNPMADYLARTSGTSPKPVCNVSATDQKAQLLSLRHLRHAGIGLQTKLRNTLNSVGRTSHTDRFFAMEVLLVTRLCELGVMRCNGEEGHENRAAYGRMASAWALMQSWFEADITVPLSGRPSRIAPMQFEQGIKSE